MQLRRTWLLICAEAVLLSCVSSAGALTLMPMEEPTVQLASPASANPAIPSVQYSSVNSNVAVSLVTANPLLCANTSAPINSAAIINPIYYSANGSVGTTPLPWVFGASANSPGNSAQGLGASISYGASMRMLGDPSLVCYGLDANGVHGPTRETFLDSFEGATFSPATRSAFNSSVAVQVFHRPTSPTDYYGYTVDVTIEPLPSSFGALCASSVDCQFSLVEGYDTSVFATTSGQWCLAPAGTFSCASPPPPGGTAPAFGDINVNYTNYATTVSLTAPIAPAGAKQYHFVAYRYFRSGVSALPASGAPVVAAALFSPSDIEEEKIDDNVAVGYANTPPAIVQNDGTWSSFAGGLSALSENTDSGALTFNITDSDTQENGNILDAAVSLNIGGLSVPVSANCTLTSAPGAVPVNRQCAIDLPLNNPGWWNANVGSAYQGLFNAVATDVANGTYANGVSASAHIVATDPSGKTSPAIDVPLHIFSGVNNAPIVAFQGAFANVSDPNNNHVYPTFACSVSAGAGAGGCGTGRLNVHVNGSMTAVPGPAAAFDELASQTTAIVPFSDPQDSITNVQCNREQQAMVFVANGGPLVVASPTQGTYDMDFLISSTAPASPVSTLCTVTVADAGFPGGQTAQTASGQFRIVINP